MKPFLWHQIRAVLPIEGGLFLGKEISVFEITTGRQLLLIPISWWLSQWRNVGWGHFLRLHFEY